MKISKTVAAGVPGLLELAMATHAGMTTEEFERIVSEWLATATHPTTGRPYTEMVYQPMPDAGFSNPGPTLRSRQYGQRSPSQREWLCESSFHCEDVVLLTATP